LILGCLEHGSSQEEVDGFGKNRFLPGRQSGEDPQPLLFAAVELSVSSFNMMLSKKKTKY